MLTVKQEQINIYKAKAQSWVRRPTLEGFSGEVMLAGGAAVCWTSVLYSPAVQPPTPLEKDDRWRVVPSSGWTDGPSLASYASLIFGVCVTVVGEVKVWQPFGASTTLKEGAARSGQVKSVGVTTPPSQTITQKK